MTMELVLRYLKLVIFFALLWGGLWLFNSQGCRRVDGSEMEPTIKRESLKWIAPDVREPAELKRGDIVSFTWIRAGQRQQNFAARIVGLPGDRIRMEKGEVRRNGEVVKEDFIQTKQRGTDDLEEMVVPGDSFFLLCDNRISNSAVDSRRIGPVSKWAIAGKIR